MEFYYLSIKVKNCVKNNSIRYLVVDYDDDSRAVLKVTSKSILICDIFTFFKHFNVLC